MADISGQKRLSKVAKEFNISTTTILDFLKLKNIEIEENPNTKISDEIFIILQEKFKLDKLNKEILIQKKEEVKEEKQEEVIQEEEKQEMLIKTNIIPRSTTLPEKKISIETKEEKVKEEKEPDTKEIKVLIEEEVVEEIILEIPQKEEEKPDNRIIEETGLKIIGKMDLETKKKKKTKEVKEKTDSKEEIKSSEQTEQEVQEIKIVEEDISKEPEIILEEEPEPPIDLGPSLKIVGKIDIDALNETPKKKLVASSADLSTMRNRRRRRFFTKKGDETVPTKEIPAKKEYQKDRFERKKPEKVKEVIDDKQIKEQVALTLAKLTSKQQSVGVAKAKIKKKLRKEKREKELIETEREKERFIEVIEFITANELANMMNVSVTEVITTCMNLGLMISINQRLDAETITIVADEFGFEVKFTTESLDEPILEEKDVLSRMKERAPVVTIMGHVDHGKTSLLDYIRKSRIIEGEAGGITQHIGAYEVTLPHAHNYKKIIFLDTPGHEAFTSMRARGAQITDIVIIVIAADDSVMPQTREAISHAQAAGVPMIFAINKIDKPGANPEKIREQLADMNILVEEWGGKFQCQEISAKKGLNINELLEKILLEAEMLELKADAQKRAIGTVIEASLDKGKGIVASVLVQKGTLRASDPLVAGAFYCKVKAMFDETGKKVMEAGPSTPIEILGFDGAPTAGDKFYVTETETQAKELAASRKRLLREQGIRATKHVTLEEIGRRIALGNFKELNIIIKGDVDGSVEALSDSLLKLSTEEIQVNVVYKSVGQITESDILLASASDAIVIGFQVRPSLNARKLAENEQIEIRLYSVIYNAIEELKLAMEGMLEPKEVEKIVSNIEVREVFKISKSGTIAGCHVLDGKLSRNNKVRIIREGVVVYSGEIASLKRFKEDVKEVTSGYECGIGIMNYNDLKTGDIIEGYTIEHTKRTL